MNETDPFRIRSDDADSEDSVDRENEDAADSEKGNPDNMALCDGLSDRTTIDRDHAALHQDSATKDDVVDDDDDDDEDSCIWFTSITSTLAKESRCDSPHSISDQSVLPSRAQPPVLKPSDKSGCLLRNSADIKSPENHKNDGLGGNDSGNKDDDHDKSDDDYDDDDKNNNNNNEVADVIADLFANEKKKGYDIHRQGDCTWLSSLSVSDSIASKTSTYSNFLSGSDFSEASWIVAKSSARASPSVGPSDVPAVSRKRPLMCSTPSKHGDFTRFVMARDMVDSAKESAPAVSGSLNGATGKEKASRKGSTVNGKTSRRGLAGNAKAGLAMKGSVECDSDFDAADLSSIHGSDCPDSTSLAGDATKTHSKIR